jgi:hypothetical protein
MKAATIYKRANMLFFHASSKTTAGVWIATPPFLCLELQPDLSPIGKAVVEALGSSQTDVPHPVKWSGILAPLLEQAGVKSWETFMRKADCLNLEATSDSLKVIPNKNLGTTEGFEPILGKAVELNLASSIEQIGTAISAGFTLCE